MFAALSVRAIDELLALLLSSKDRRCRNFRGKCQSFASIWISSGLLFVFILKAVYTPRLSGIFDLQTSVNSSWLRNELIGCFQLCEWFCDGLEKMCQAYKSRKSSVFRPRSQRNKIILNHYEMWRIQFCFYFQNLRQLTSISHWRLRFIIICTYK